MSEVVAADVCVAGQRLMRGKSLAVCQMDVGGRKVDGSAIVPGDVFRTFSGRCTTPYPRQKSERWASQWLIDNAIQEASARGDRFNARSFSSEAPLKDGSLCTAGRDAMLEYLFGWQPAVPRDFLKPLVACHE